MKPVNRGGVLQLVAVKQVVWLMLTNLMKINCKNICKNKGNCVKTK